MTHPAQRLDAFTHQRVRLGILMILSEVRRADFKYLKDALELTDGNLSRNLQALEESGYIRITKTFEGKRPRTWLALTSAGRTALKVEIETLRDIVALVDAQPDQASSRTRTWT